MTDPINWRDDKPAPEIDYAAADKQGPCESLHVQPEEWVLKNGAAWCPKCGKWMGRKK